MRYQRARANACDLDTTAYTVDAARTEVFMRAARFAAVLFTVVASAGPCVDLIRAIRDAELSFFTASPIWGLLASFPLLRMTLVRALVPVPLTGR